MPRQIIRIDGPVTTVAVESRFDSESQLQQAITAHPEVLPVEDIGTEQLAVLASELDLGAGPMDLLAADSHGHIAIVEFKKGTENRAVREVIAQMLHYGSALWRTEYGDLEKACRRAGMKQETLEEQVRTQVNGDSPFDPEEFRQSVAATLLWEGNLAQAEMRAAQAAVMWTHADSDTRIHVRRVEAVVSAHLGRNKDAISRLCELLSTAREMFHLWEAATILESMAAVQKLAGDPQAAESSLREALAAFQQLRAEGHVKRVTDLLSEILAAAPQSGSV